jgi:hypothetical protein
MRDIDDIDKKVKKRKDQLQSLFEKDKENYDLWLGKEQIFDTHPMSVNITGTEMTALSRRVQSSLTRSRLDVRVLPPNPQPNDKAVEEANREEDMYYYGFDMADERLSSRGEAPLLSSVAWQIVVLGRTAVRVLVYKDNKDIIWDYLPMIPSLVTFEFDIHGLSWYRYETFRSPACIKNEYGKEVTEDLEGKGVSISDYWDREHNVRYLTKSKELLQADDNDLGFVPAIIQPVNLGPRAIESDGIDVTAWGQAIFDHVKTPFKNLNKLRSIVATQAFINAQPPLVAKHKDGSDVEITEQEISRYPMAVINVPDTVDFDTLKTMEVPPSILTMMGDISTGIQRATYTELSPDAPGHSGSALKILRQDMQDVLSPREDAINKLYTGICRMSKKQVLVRKLTIPVKTVVRDNYEVYDIKPKMLDNDFYVGAEFVRQDVYDEVEMLQEAQLYQQNKWMSRSSIMEKQLRMQDVPAEIEKMDMDEVEAAIPELKLRKMIKRLQDRYDDLRAQEINDPDLADTIKQLKEQLGMLTIQKQQSVIPQPQQGQPQGQPRPQPRPAMPRVPR